MITSKKEKGAIETGVFDPLTNTVLTEVIQFAYKKQWWKDIFDLLIHPFDTFNSSICFFFSPLEYESMCQIHPWLTAGPVWKFQPVRALD